MPNTKRSPAKRPARTASHSESKPPEDAAALFERGRKLIENAPPVPDWIAETPEEQTYGLVMWEGHAGSALQEVGITRDEYLELKRHLAATRGYTIAGVGRRVSDLASEMQISIEQMRFHVGVARELYRRCPEAIASEAGLEAVLKEVLG